MFGKLFGFSTSYQNMSSSEFETGLSQDKSIVLIDVRTQPEFKDGHIPGARNFDVMDGTFQREAEKFDPGQTYYIYCRSGGRSASACNMLGKMGFKNVVNLSGGMMSWKGKVKRG